MARGTVNARPHEDAAAGDHEDLTTVVDPVCGMCVEGESARSKGLHSPYQGRDYYFCGKGCKLEFDDDPEHFLDPAYLPSM